jgi:hypothetical protein
MKKIVLFLFALASGFALRAQVTPPATPLSDSLTARVCNCLKKDAPKIADMEGLQSKLGECMGNADITVMKKAAKEQGIDPESDDAPRQLGRAIGKRLMRECPSFLELTKRLAAAQKREQSGQ